MTAKIQFIGAAGTVTGSKTIVQKDDYTVLVDCGLFQGLKHLRLKNWKQLPVPASQIDAIILTHAHVDHSGYLPRLMKEGFQGKIYCTKATKELCRILLPDCGYLQEEDAFYANRKGFSKHRPALPLYTEADGRAVMAMFSVVEFGDRFKLGPFTCHMNPVGHILGASCAIIETEGKKICFSGDVGRQNDLIMQAPAKLESVDVLCLESTYGDRLHPVEDPIAIIKKEISEVRVAKGVLLIPSFAVARTQEILFCIYEIFKENPALQIPVYVNSPMATDVTDLYKEMESYHKLDDELCAKVCSIAQFVRSIDESVALNNRKGPHIIISASGMLSGGRVLHHLKSLAPNPQNTILLPGYQAAGTRGASLVNGQRELKLHGQYIPVEAKIVHMESLSAHADQAELIMWLKSAQKTPQRIFLMHGEFSAADTLRMKISRELGVETSVVEEGMVIEL